ncbi:MogA/MoaB family molybdenum cofactor biosynthesis protein [Syntrophorhabdus aromaticivorans]|uniref:Molybdopterin adenylyltransferase n=1 Tax=Syntrophorhabdus aromaticivorans TaxID=328301 RepID=A0A351U5R1_9BACT|nr:MogA/MoaB family molybdenum cofactor biosynthesis protein [Syntrophorhabdus aromaticivorans]NLW34374.1 MogA/MoaB family molybdenum cofactor biosynthesis protein [Syntrophorhabdus aromaticivorans]HBA55292.1 MogA/MoaB family molybdenum cofactor biosynthesis protein [Syntrophorhabdus aromaticivorans]
MKYTAVIVTVSDKGSVGQREDKSGPALREVLEGSYDVKEIVIVPDEIDIIARTLRDLIDIQAVDLIVTTGGTGVAKRDVTPEATKAVLEKELPGFAEIIRMESYKVTPTAIISRGLCGIRGESVIINLPGSPKAAVESLGFVLGALPHTLEKLKGDTSDCGSV